MLPPSPLRAFAVIFFLIGRWSCPSFSLEDKPSVVAARALDLRQVRSLIKNCTDADSINKRRLSRKARFRWRKHIEFCRKLRNERSIEKRSKSLSKAFDAVSSRYEEKTDGVADGATDAESDSSGNANQWSGKWVQAVDFAWNDSIIRHSNQAVNETDIFDLNSSSEADTSFSWLHEASKPKSDPLPLPQATVRPKDGRSNSERLSDQVRAKIFPRYKFKGSLANMRSHFQAIPPHSKPEREQDLSSISKTEEFRLDYSDYATADPAPAPKGEPARPATRKLSFRELNVGEWRSNCVMMPGYAKTNRVVPPGMGKPCLCPDSNPGHGFDPQETPACVYSNRNARLRDERSTYKFHLRRKRRSFPTLAKQDRLSISPLAIRTVFEFYAVVEWPCSGEERLGSWGEGGKWVCRPERLNSRSIIYSVGSNTQVSFEQDVYALTGAVSYTFDPTLQPGALAYMGHLRFLRFSDVGLSGSIDAGKMHRIRTIMGSLNHSFVDVLKVDCEGCELDFIDDLVRTSRRRRDKRALFGQILVEFHTFENPSSLVRPLQSLKALGYLLFHVEQNYQCSVCVEMAYIHRSVLNKA